MKTFAVNAMNDVYTENGLLVLATDMDALTQRCTQVMSAVRGEMLYAVDQGMPFYETIWTGSPNLLAFEAASRVELLRIPEVKSVDAFTASISNNELSYRAQLTTTLGAVTVNGEL